MSAKPTKPQQASQKDRQGVSSQFIEKAVSELKNVPRGKNGSK